VSSYLTVELRRLVVSRAEGLCEYCMIHEADTFFGCEIDHIVSEKHGGVTEPENLAFACFFCNRHKGTDLGSIAGPTNRLIRFFNPRTDRWPEHFVLDEDGMIIQPRTEVGM
jgi:5-methylcytosine-specific restriction endonuclease McrA